LTDRYLRPTYRVRTLLHGITLTVIAQGPGRFGLIDRRVLIWRWEGRRWWLSYEGRHPDWTPRPPA